jgi:hypothetical protein
MFDATHNMTSRPTERKCARDGISTMLIMGAGINPFSHKAFIFRKNEKPTFIGRSF